MTVTTSTCLAEFALRLGGDERGARARLARDVDRARGGRQIAGSGRDEEQIARADRRRRHVAPDRDVAAHVEEPHREAAHLQALAPEAEHDDPLRLDDRLDQRVGASSGMRRENALEIAQRALRQ